MRRVHPALLFPLLLCASLRLGGEVYQNRRLVRGDWQADWVAGMTPVNQLWQEAYDADGPVRDYYASSAGDWSLGIQEDWVRGSDWGGGIGGILYSQPEYGNATTAKYYNYDGRGDVVALTSNVGNITYAAAYNAYGQHATVTSGNVTTTGTQEVGTDTDLFRLTTKEEDPTGLSYQINRYLSLTDNNWLSRDPLGLATGPNPYTYVEQNNWTKFDPLGEETEDQYETDEIKAQEAHDSALKNLDAKDPDHDAKQKDIEDRYKDRMSIDQKGINLIETSAKEMHVDAKTLDDSSMDFKMHQLAKTAGILGDLGMMADGAGEAEVLIAGGKELIGEMLGEDAAESGDGLVNLASEGRTTHILTGDASGGGHMFPGLPGKTAFPEGWSGPQIMHEVSDIATDPAAVRTVQSNGRILVTGTRNGVQINVVLEPASKGGGIVTAFPAK